MSIRNISKEIYINPEKKVKNIFIYVYTFMYSLINHLPINSVQIQYVAMYVSLFASCLREYWFSNCLYLEQVHVFMQNMLFFYFATLKPASH